MAAFRRTATSKRVRQLRSIRKLAPYAQCAGVTRRGARCSRRVTASTLPGQPSSVNSAKFCKTHLRIVLNQTVGWNVGRPAATSSYTGMSARPICLSFFISISLCPTVYRRARSQIDLQLPHQGPLTCRSTGVHIRISGPRCVPNDLHITPP